MHYQLLHGDNREQLKHIADNSIDSIVCDPPYELGFMGSGSTGCAAMCEGVNFVGIELSEEYLEIARRRIEYWQSQNPMGL